MLSYVLFGSLRVASDQPLDAARNSTDSPNLTVPSDFQIHGVEWSRWWTVQYITRLSIECTFVARTLQALMISIEINRTGEMCTLLPKSVITTIERPHQDRGIFLGRITKVKRGAGRQSFRAFDF